MDESHRTNKVCWLAPRRRAFDLPSVPRRVDELATPTHQRGVINHDWLGLITVTILMPDDPNSVQATLTSLSIVGTKSTTVLSKGDSNSAGVSTKESTSTLNVDSVTTSVSTSRKRTARELSPDKNTDAGKNKRAAKVQKNVKSESVWQVERAWQTNGKT
jgi:hypothetical protein